MARARSRFVLPLRVAYPTVGALLAVLLAAGLLVVRLAAGGDVTSDAAARELATNPLTYAYVATSAGALLVALGVALGAKEDTLWATSNTDPLTHVANRRHFEATIDEEVARAIDSGMPLALLVVDLDRLKRINDALGHAAGDAALRALGDTIRGCARSRDLSARFGGDEFVVVMPRTRAAEAWSFAERLRVSLAASWARKPAWARMPPPTVSIGIADLASARARTAEALFAAADAALYAAKRSGRDRAVVASQLDDTATMSIPSSNVGEATSRALAPAVAPCRCDESSEPCAHAESGAHPASPSAPDSQGRAWPAAG